MKKHLEQYAMHVDWHKDYMGIQVHKNMESPTPLYLVKDCELQMWQHKDRLIAWLRRVADEVEKMP